MANFGDIANHFFEGLTALAAAYAGWKSRQAKNTSDETATKVDATASKTREIHEEVKSPNGLTTAAAINDVRDTVNRLGRELISRDSSVEKRFRDLSKEIASVAKMVGTHMADDHTPTTPSTTKRPSPRKPGTGGRGRSGT